MQTLGEMIERVLRMESQEDTFDQNTRFAVRDAINEAYQTLCTVYQWGWLVTEADVATTSGDTHLVLPADFIALLAITNSNGVLMHPRTLQRQLEKKSTIESIGRMTYALDGVDATTGGMRLRLVPASTGDTYTVTYQRMPTGLSADADVPVGPVGVDTYLVRQARFLRVEDDEEQPYVTRTAERRSMEALSRIARTAGQPLRQLTGAIMPMGS